jgi:hypothetical protein
MGVERFKGHHLWITWPQLTEQSLLRNIESRKRWNRIAGKLKGDIQIKIVANWKTDTPRQRIYGSRRRGEPEVLGNWLCPFLGREAWIAWDGIFNVCCSPVLLRCHKT